MSIRRRVFLSSFIVTFVPLLFCGGIYYLLFLVNEYLTGANNEGAFVLRQWVESNKRLIYIVIAAVFVLSILLIVLSAVLSFLLTKRILNPLKTLKNAANEVKTGNLDYHISYNGNDEFHEVIEEFNAMTERLKATIIENLQFQEDNKTLLASITHDLKTPITSIRGYLEGIADGVADTDEKRRKYLSTALSKVNDMNVLIDELFLASKLDLRKLPIRPERCELVSYMREFYEEQKEALAEDCEFSFSSRVEAAEASIDKAEFRRVLVNLVDNSRKYRSGLPLQIAIEIVENPRNIVVKLMDNGAGVPEEELEHIFKAFYRGDKSRGAPQNGSGLGLSIARDAIEGMGGRIWARKNEPRGLSIYISLNKEKP